MARLASINHQLHERMEALDVIGESRHLAKLESGTHKTVGIHSYGTYQRIKDVSQQFSGWLKSNHQEIKDIRTVGAPTVMEYLSHRLDQNLSPWTLRSDMSSLNKLFNLGLTAKTCGLPIKRNSEVFKGRGGHRLISLAPWADHITIAKATGCRRASMLKISAKDFIKLPDGSLVLMLTEKGGKDRSAPVLASMTNQVKAILQERSSGPLFTSFSKRLQSHQFRREYAADLYKELLGNRQDKQNYKGYDSDILSKVSQAMGHNRISVVVDSYLPKR